MINIPVKNLELTFFLFAQEFEEEVETKFTAALTLRVLINTKLHDLEVEEVCFLLRIENFDFNLRVVGPE